MGFDPYREEEAPDRFDKWVALAVGIVIVALVVWALFF